MDKIIAELERRADEYQAKLAATKGNRTAYYYERFMVLYRGWGHALRNGGGCGCHGKDNGTPCPDPACHGTGIDATTRELLAALGGAA